MTEKLYDLDSHLKEFTAEVTGCFRKGDYFAAELSRTAFFPEGGGQGSDRGEIDGVQVIDVQETDGRIFHFTRSPLNTGATVTGRIDWARRFDFMQQHSGEHIVSGIAHSLWGCENVGFHLGESIVTLDFDRTLSREQLLKTEEAANRAVFQNKGFFTYYPDDTELKKLDYRSKKEIDGPVRIVEIEDTDICACCAPHVGSAGEIGIIKLLDTEKLRGGIRIEIKCGMRALLDYNDKYGNVKKIASALAVKQSEAAMGVDRLMDSLSELKLKITALSRKVLEEEVKSFHPQSEITAWFSEECELKELQFLADALFKAHGGIRGVFAPAPEGFFFAVCGGKERLEDFFTNFKAKLPVRGGGRNGMVQGTVYAKEADIKSFFENYLLS